MSPNVFSSLMGQEALTEHRLEATSLSLAHGQPSQVMYFKRAEENEQSYTSP